MVNEDNIINGEKIRNGDTGESIFKEENEEKEDWYGNKTFAYQRARQNLGQR